MGRIDITRQRNLLRNLRPSLIHLVLLLPLAVACSQQEVSASPSVVASLADLSAAVVRVEVDANVELVNGHAEGTFSGSGFFITNDGYIVTNNHVVAGATSILVHAKDAAESLPADVVGVAECADLAVLKVSSEEHLHLEWAAARPSVGEQIYAAGFPLGDPEFTLQDGIISKERANGDTPWSSVRSVVEHSAHTLPGSSGGPIVNSDSAVVAVNYARDDYGQAFGIPVDVARTLVEQIIAGVSQESIGISPWAYSDGVTTGVWVEAVTEGSPADMAGIRPGDVITEIDDLLLGSEDLSVFCGVLRQHPADEELPVEIWRTSESRGYSGALLSGRKLTAMGPARPASSTRNDPIHVEQLLLDVLDEWSAEQPYITVVDYMTDQELLAEARRACERLGRGATFDALLDNLSALIDPETYYDMAFVYAMSIAALCPEYEYAWEEFIDRHG